ncbi:hypothetical protein DLM_1777 [Aquitalea magnusonii]|uniref:Uncharacterized protein n=1 Tax=Aquitalea magnusonii TaxID=332411 RepID=A0A3G9GEZ7_9NEIS|nr:hypothetical protein DLM_1777 [Aquitalea magnusonii]
MQRRRQPVQQIVDRPAILLQSLGHHKAYERQSSDHQQGFHLFAICHFYQPSITQNA